MEIYCTICKYYKSHRCSLWQVKVDKPEDSHCESCQIKKS